MNHNSNSYINIIYDIMHSYFHLEFSIILQIEVLNHEYANFRYNACWLPLLAKHSESRISEGPLVVPLDCEWVWHCHRLNPVGFYTKNIELSFSFSIQFLFFCH
jgi:hypothetical protein